MEVENSDYIMNIIIIFREQLDYMTNHLDTYGKEYPIDKHEKQTKDTTCAIVNEKIVTGLINAPEQLINAI